MAEAFLSELLRMQNSVHSEGESCAVCLEKYGTLSRETGTIEVAIRLPCNHLIGSGCITTWLKENNSCPICRREFFPAQRRPDFEDDILHPEEDEYVEDEVNWADIGELNREYCEQLALNPDITVLSKIIAEKLMESEDWSEGHTEGCMVAVSIYIASHLTHEPRSPREIAAVTMVEADHIRFSYDSFYPTRRLFADEVVLWWLEIRFDERPDEVESLNWPATGYDRTDDQIEGDGVSRSRTVLQICREACGELGLDDRTAESSIRIARNLCEAMIMDDFSPESMAAVGIFVVCHLTNNPVGIRRVVEAVGASELSFRSAYNIALSNLYRFFEEAGLRGVETGITESAVARLPRL